MSRAVVVLPEPDGPASSTAGRSWRMGGDEIGRADDLLFIKSAVMLQHRGGVLRKQGAELIGRHRAFLLWVPEKPGRVSFQYSTTRGKMLTDF